MLVERGDRAVALSVAQNAGAKFSEAGYVRLVKRSEHDDELARSVGSRQEIPRHHFLKLLSTASKAVRLALEGAHPEHAKRNTACRGQGYDGDPGEAAAKSRDYAEARARVETLRAAGKLNESAIAASARAGSFEDTAVMLAELSALPVDVVERVLVQDRVETILIVAKVIELSWATVRVLLLLRAGTGGLSTQALEQHMGELHAAEACDGATGDRVPAKTSGGGFGSAPLTASVAVVWSPRRGALFAFPRGARNRKLDHTAQTVGHFGYLFGAQFAILRPFGPSRAHPCGNRSCSVVGCAGFDGVKDIAEIVGNERDELVAHGAADVPQLTAGLMGALQHVCIVRVAGDLLD